MYKIKYWMPGQIQPPPSREEKKEKKPEYVFGYILCTSCGNTSPGMVIYPDGTCNKCNPKP